MQLVGIGRARASGVGRVTRAIGAWAFRFWLSPYVAIALLVALASLSLVSTILAHNSAGPWPTSRAELWAQVPSLTQRGGPASWVPGVAWTGRLWRAFLVLVLVSAGFRATQVWVRAWSLEPPGTLVPLTWTSNLDPAAAWNRITAALAKDGQCMVRRTSVGGVERALSRRWGWRGWVPGLLYLGAMLLQVPACLPGAIGWSGQPREIALGESQPLGDSQAHVLRLDEIEIRPGSKGLAPMMSFGTSLRDAGGRAASVRLRPGHSVSAEGLRLYLLGFGPAARVNARSESGRDMVLQRTAGDATRRANLHVRFSGPQQEQLIAVPEAGLTVRLVHYPSLPAQGFPGRALHIQVYRGSDGSMVAEGFTDTDTVLSLPGVSVGTSLEYYAIVRAERGAGLPIVVTGAVLVIVGIICTALWPERALMWSMSPQQGGTLCQVVAPRRDSQSPWLRRLFADVTA